MGQTKSVKKSTRKEGKQMKEKFVYVFVVEHNGNKFETQTIATSLRKAKNNMRYRLAETGCNSTWHYTMTLNGNVIEINHSVFKQETKETNWFTDESDGCVYDRFGEVVSDSDLD